MKRELGIAMCGLACCLCSENGKCDGCLSDTCHSAAKCENRKCCIEKGLPGCYVCETGCRKGLLKGIRTYGFTMYIKRYGVESLLNCLEENERRGIVYHRTGFTGDYDDFDDMEKLIEFIKTGKR